MRLLLIFFASFLLCVPAFSQFEVVRSHSTLSTTPAATPSSPTIWDNAGTLTFRDTGGTDWVFLSSIELSLDTTPQLGGNLDLNSQEIISLAGIDIVFRSGKNLDVVLGDALGVDDFRILDSGNVEQVRIDSDGNAFFGAGLTPAAGVEMEVYQAIDSANLHITSETDNAYIRLTSNEDGLGTEVSGIQLYDDASSMWVLQKDTGNDFNIFDSTRAAVVFEILDNGNMILMGAGGDIDIGTSNLIYGTGTLSNTDLELLDSGDIDLATEVAGVLPDANIDALLHRDSEIKDGDLTSFDDENNDYAATNVDEAIEELVTDPGAGPNLANGKVHWDNLVGVPAGFADNSDDGAGGGGDAAEVETGDDAGTFDTIDTTFRLEDQGDINFVFTDGGAGGPDTITALVRANSVALGTDTTGSYAAGDAEAGAALTGDSATAFFSEGAIEAARGGTGIDTGASTGVARVSTGTWSVDATLAHLGASAGQIDDDDLAAGAVDGGVGGEIADGTVDANDLATDSVSADELNATGVEAEIETEVFDADAQNILGIWEVQDDIDLNFGTDADWSFNYDESVDNQLLLETTATAALTTTDPMFQILVGTPVTTQQVFGIAKGTQATNTDLLTLTGDGDLILLGNFNATSLDVNNITITEDTVAPETGVGQGAIWVNSADNGLYYENNDEGDNDQRVTTTQQIDTYAELNTIVADQTLTHNALIDTFAELDAIVADKGLVNLVDGIGFGSITTGTNTAATMTVGDGASIDVTGTGDVEAREIVMPATTSAGTSTIATTNIVYISTAFDATNGCVEVELADADGAGTMPAIGVVTATVNDGDCNGEITVSGFLDGFEMGAFSPGDALYVSTTAGGVTSTKPTGEGSEIQKIAQVVRNTGAGDRLQVFGAGRSNDVPNLDSAAIFVGSSGNAATAVDVTGDVTISNTGVTTIGNGAVAVANLVNGTDGELITWDAAGAPATVATGTSGQVLTSNGAGAAPTFQDITESETFTILEPDIAQPITDEVLLKYFAAEKYPNGVTMVSWHVATSANVTDTFNLIESASPTASTPSTMESITLTAANEGEDDGTFTDGAVAADGYVFLDFGAVVPDNVAALYVTITYTID